MSKPMRKFTQREIDRFWSYVDKSSEDQCWCWLKSTDSSGYGRFRAGGKLWKANRVAYYLHFLLDPGLEQVCHSCDNPSCCNPKHLWLGSQGDNIRDCWAKGRGIINHNQRGASNHRARLTESDISEIRKLYKAGKVTQIQLGDMFGVSHSTIHLITTRKTWSHL